MYAGMYSVGDWLPLFYQHMGTTGVAASPGAQPTARIYNSSGTLVVTIDLAAFRPDVETGMFTGRWQVSAVGRGFILYNAGTDAIREEECFDVEGGNANGQIIAAFPLKRPEGDYLIYETDQGTVYQGRGPY